MPDENEFIGERFGEYRLLRFLGSGGSGQVYLGEHLYDRSRAAVKLLPTRLSKNQDLKAFLNEARTFRLTHPNIVRILDFGKCSFDYCSLSQVCHFLPLVNALYQKRYILHK
ncbi:hypothetical protein EPA93_47955 [Ktedonosporobacter rubrisoli]|uniref:Protein kinase domain-containing protein n=1 Tax=Ktedonosporobacter rubrisoli TaxID=2509675 RepID=A0A4P6K5L8_KTERU|nr:hypothetical protein EPA93_47955 [Ktedonosporobacter rubrisoli]